MIIPLVHEEEWLESLSSLPIEETKARRRLVVAPHPDDETLGVGGWIASQCRNSGDVSVVAVTDGENAYGEDHSGLADRRTSEQAKALDCLGLPRHKITRLHLVDSDVASSERELVECLFPLVDDETHVVAPWTGDFHPDHEACGRAAIHVAKRLRAKLSFYFVWLWHRGTPSLLQGLPLRSFHLTDELLEAKLHALGCHQSQLVRSAGEPILPERLLAPARRRFEILLPYAD